MPSNEPLLNALDIQGNLPGFRRRQQRLVGFPGHLGSGAEGCLADRPRLADGPADGPRAQGRSESRFPREFGGAGQTDLWLNYALGVRAADALGLERLRDLELAFGVGMPERAGDTTAPKLQDGSFDPTCPENWKVGGPNRPLDLMLIFAADRAIEQASAPLVTRIEASGLRRIYAEVGELLPEDKEHFGFRTASPTSVLGVVEVDGVQRFVTTQYGVPGLLGVEFGKPGQPLVPPEQFLFDDEADLRNGSFLVFRRLTQDIPGFDAGTAAMAAALSGRLGRAVTPDELRTRVVGRWPSGSR